MTTPLETSIFRCRPEFERLGAIVGLLCRGRVGHGDEPHDELARFCAPVPRWRSTGLARAFSAALAGRFFGGFSTALAAGGTAGAIAGLAGRVPATISPGLCQEPQPLRLPAGAAAVAAWVDDGAATAGAPAWAPVGSLIDAIPPACRLRFLAVGELGSNLVPSTGGCAHPRYPGAAAVRVQETSAPPRWRSAAARGAQQPPIGATPQLVGVLRFVDTMRQQPLTLRLPGRFAPP